MLESSFANAWMKRPKDILWIVSNCDSDTSNRMEFVKALKAALTNLTIDIYGKCSENGQRLTKETEVTLLQEYKFYLAFENSLCKDYITEKFFKALEANIIPIARGARKR